MSMQRSIEMYVRNPIRGISVAVLLLAGCSDQDPQLEAPDTVAVGGGSLEKAGGEFPGTEGTPISDPGTPGGGSRAPIQGYVWQDKAILSSLPASGPAWDNLTDFAKYSFYYGGFDPRRHLNVTLFDKDSNADVLALAKALVYVRAPEIGPNYRTEIQQAVQAMLNDWNNLNSLRCTDEPLSVARNLPGYIIAADYVGLDEPLGSTFRRWLATMYDEPLCEDYDCVRDDRSLHETMLTRANNWGTMAMASMAAIAAYRNDNALLSEVSRVLDGWMGNRAAYARFGYGDLSWQANATAPVGIGPPGSSISAGDCMFSTDGALPEELRRGQFCDPNGGGCDSTADCDLDTPGTQCKVVASPVSTCELGSGLIQKTQHIYGALGGAVVCAEILRRHGYPQIYEWDSQALKRAGRWLQDRAAEDPSEGWWFAGDDTFVPWLLNKAYGTAFPTAYTTNSGKNVSFTDWTHQ
jgi:hypothetical protein